MQEYIAEDLYHKKVNKYKEKMKKEVKKTKFAD